MSDDGIGVPKGFGVVGDDILGFAAGLNASIAHVFDFGQTAGADGDRTRSSALFGVKAVAESVEIAH